MSAVGSFPLGAATTLAELAADPHPRLARLRAHEPVSWLPELDGWLVTRRDLALNVMRDPATFTVDDPGSPPHRSSARACCPWTVTSTPATGSPSPLPSAPGKYATASPRSSSGRPTGSSPRWNRRAPSNCDAPSPGPLAVAVVTEALGLVGTTADTVLSWYDAIVRSVSDITAGHEAAPAGAEAYARLRAAVEATVADPGAASLLGSAAERLELPEVASNAAVLMFGGIETTEAMITNALLHLLRHPGQLALVRADDGLLDGAIEESLRLEPGAAVVDRYATRDTVLGPAMIRQGELVTVSLAAPTATRPSSPIPIGSTSAARTRVSSWPSRTARTTASPRTSPDWRPVSPFSACSNASPPCAWTQPIRPLRRGWSSASRPPCMSCGTAPPDQRDTGVRRRDLRKGRRSHRRAGTSTYSYRSQASARDTAKAVIAPIGDGVNRCCPARSTSRWTM